MAKRHQDPHHKSVAATPATQNNSEPPVSDSAPDYAWLTPTLAVMGQISAADIPALHAAGFKTIINNRPDDEEPGQPTAAETQAAVEAAGLAYIYQPFATN